MTHRHRFVVKEAPYSRLCSNKTILTVNGQFPGPTLNLTEGDTLVVDVINNSTENVTIHWHGVKQPRYPWSDGPEYITQCPIRPGQRFRQKIALSDEVGTMWWHAHSDWSRATVHGLLVVYPKNNGSYPFPKPHAEVPIVLGEWWKSDIRAVLSQFLQSGGDPNISDAFLINGQPGDLYPCSRSDTYKVTFEFGKTYLFRMVNAVMNNIMFFKIANHNVTVVGTDGAYTKPLQSDYIAISPGQTIDFLVTADQPPNNSYYMAARVYARGGSWDNTTTTAIISYSNSSSTAASPTLPVLPEINDTSSSVNFTGKLRSPGPVDVPTNISRILFFTLSINLFPCNDPNFTNCAQGPFGGRLRASINNVTFVQPKVDILGAYYRRIRGVFGKNFPNEPPVRFNFTGGDIQDYRLPMNGTRVVVLEYNSTVELVFQGTALLGGIDHPMHLHGHSFYVVGWGFGNFDKERDPLNYNLVDPPLQNTIAVPINGWTAIRFTANNPGVWLMHCHLERHISWGMETVFIVKNGRTRESRMLPPPPDVPKC